MTTTYNLFISHSWSYSDAYEKMTNLLNNAPYFRYKNYSVPRDDPVHDANNDAALYRAIKEQISFCHAVIILAGVYSTYSKWINNEIKISKIEFSKPKPIIAVQPWASERTSSVVKENADLIVGWNTDSIVDGIRRLV